MDGRTELPRLLIESAADAVIVRSKDGLIALFNPAAERLLGHAAKDVLGRPYDLLVPPEARAAEAAVFERAALGEAVPARDTAFLRKSGFSLRVSASVSPLAGSGAAVVARDVSERARADDVLREKSERLAAAMKASGIGSWTWNLMKNTLIFDDLLHPLFGLKPGEFSGEFEDFLALIHPEDRDLVRRSASDAGADYDAQYRVVWPDGTARFLRARGLVSRDKEGRAVWITGVSWDITTAKRAEEELGKALRAALDLARIKSELLANMSHELRTPLNAVIGMTSLLLETELSPRQRELAQVMQSSADALLGIISDVLDLSKLDADRMELESVDFDPRKAVHDSAALVAMRAKDKGLALEVQVDAAVPGGLRGDPGRFKQILVNLLANAVKFTEKGSVRLRVAQADSTARDATLRVEVEDTGIGIAPEQADRIFRAFTQADASMTRKYGGTGLGLSITKKLVALIGGDIGVASEPGRGSTFWCTLRFDRAASEQTSEAALPRAKARSAAAEYRPLRILIAEDNAVNLKVALMELEQLGYAADFAGNGKEALEILRRAPYDIILMDCQMPEMDGFTATREIRRREGAGRRTIIVAMTANALEGDRQKCLAAGMDDYLPKPVRLEDLRRVMERWDIPLDLDALKGLRELGGSQNPGFAREVAADYIKEAEPRLAALGEAKARSAAPAKEIEEAAHFLKGSSSNIGARVLAGLCARLEASARGADSAQSRGLIEAIRGEFVRVKEALKSQLGL